MTLYKFLKSIRACRPALKWVAANKFESPKQAWEACENADDLFWISVRLAGEPGWLSKQEVIAILCDYVEPVLQLIPAGEERPRRALETARAWTRGEANEEDCRQASADADAAADDARAAAWYVAAVTADDARAAAGYAADAAAGYAADAAAARAADADDDYAVAAAAADVTNAVARASNAGIELMSCDELRTKLKLGEIKMGE